MHFTDREINIKNNLFNIKARSYDYICCWMCSKNTSQYLREHLTRPIELIFAERFGDFQISRRSHRLISVTRFPVKSTTLTVKQATAEIRLLKFLRDRTIPRRQPGGYGLVFRSPIDSTRICQSCVAITNNKSFRGFIAWKSSIVVPRFYSTSALRRRRRCRSPSLFSALLYAVVTARLSLSRLAREWSLRM